MTRVKLSTDAAFSNLGAAFSKHARKLGCEIDHLAFGECEMGQLANRAANLLFLCPAHPQPHLCSDPVPPELKCFSSPLKGKFLRFFLILISIDLWLIYFNYLFINLI